MPLRNRSLTWRAAGRHARRDWQTRDRHGLLAEGPSPLSRLWTILAGRTFGETSHPPTRVQEDGVRGSSFVKTQTLTASRSLRDHLFTASSVAVLRLLGCQSIKLLTLAETRSRECSRDVFPAAETTFQPPFGSNSLTCVHTRRDCCHR